MLFILLLFRLAEPSVSNGSTQAAYIGNLLKIRSPIRLTTTMIIKMYFCSAYNSIVGALFLLCSLSLPLVTGQFDCPREEEGSTKN